MPCGRAALASRYLRQGRPTRLVVGTRHSMSGSRAVSRPPCEPIGSMTCQSSCRTFSSKSTDADASYAVAAIAAWSVPRRRRPSIPSCSSARSRCRCGSCPQHGRVQSGLILGSPDRRSRELPVARPPSLRSSKWKRSSAPASPSLTSAGATPGPPMHPARSTSRNQRSANSAHPDSSRF
jgi:hypothetical protein